MTATKLRLAQARRDGADRLFGRPVCSRWPGPATYSLTAKDGNGRVYFRRELLWEAYRDAVTYWMSLGTPNQTTRPEGKHESAAA